MKRLIIFIGPPAGGKTSTAFELSKELPNSSIIEVDKIKEQISGSVFADNDQEREVWFQSINLAIVKALESSDNIIIDEGFFSKKYLHKILNETEDYPKIIIKIIFSLEEHLKRDSERTDGGNKGAVTKIYNLFVKAPEEEQIKPDLTITDSTLTQREITERILERL